jgi:paraquat-inducible protein B
MSMRANPTAIGLFLIGGTVLTVAGVGTLAATSWFSTESTFVSYFDESVNGLEVGAAVKFQGVPVGRVTDLLIQIGLEDKTFQVPVQYDVDLSRLTVSSGGFVHLNDKSVLQQQIADGLRAQLQMESIVTGQLYIELVYRSDATPPKLARLPTAHPEIPTSPSLLAAFGSRAGSLVSDALKVLFRVNEMLASVNMEEINRSVVASAGAVERLADSQDLRDAFGQVPGMAAQFNSTMTEMQTLMERLDETVKPMAGQVAATNNEMVLTLQTLRKAVEDARGLYSTDSGVGYQMEGAMISLKEAADALRTLVQSLDRNPDMLIRGRKPGGN